MAFITYDTFVIMNKKKYQESLISLKEQKLNQIEEKQKALKNELNDNILSLIIYEDDSNYIYNDYSIIYKEAICVSDGCYHCNKYIPYFWPSLWQFEFELNFIVEYKGVIHNKKGIKSEKEYIESILNTINVTSRGYTINDLLNYAYGCCSNTCRKNIAKKCTECQRSIKPNTCTAQRFCSTECYNDSHMAYSRYMMRKY